ncbi:MAG: hypothetical protein ABIJ91_01590 [Candidatus Kuenenbacteria bacterium]
MNLNYKRIILGILILVIGIGLLAGVFWLVFLRSGPVPGEAPGGVVPGGELPGIGPAGDLGIAGPGGTLPGSAIGDAESQGPGDDAGNFSVDNIANGSLTLVENVIDEGLADVDLEGNGLSYLSLEDYKFYRVSLDGSNKTLLSDKAFPYVKNVFWSPDNKKVILEYPDGSNIYYDLAQDKQITLPTGMTEPVWHEDSKQIAYKYIGAKEEDNWIVVSDSDGGKAVPIEPVGNKGGSVQVSWSPTSEVVAFYHKSIGLNREEVYFIGLNDENFKSLVVEGSNFKGLWSPRGDMILYHVISNNNNYNPVLWVSDAQGDNIGHNNFNLGLSTWVDKCAFSLDNKTVYCAVPTSLPEGAGFYPDLLNDKSDVFYKIDLLTGISKLVAYPVFSEELDKFQVKKLFIAEDDGKLFFWDSFTDKLYFMRLK